MGVVKITGVIRLDQFWPRGKSEAGGSVIKITVDKNSFAYSDNGTDYSPIQVFREASVVYHRKTQKIIKRGNQLLVRFQGVDIPELNYKFLGSTPLKHPTRRGSLNQYEYEQLIQINNDVGFRQPCAEYASQRLYEFLSRESHYGEVPCIFTATASSPSDVSDTYGRLTGEVEVPVKGKPVNLNLWLLEKGLGFPLLSSDMSPEKVKLFIDAAEAGKSIKNSIHPSYREFLGVFDHNRRYREPFTGANLGVDTAADKGHLVMPKLFRRWCTYNIYRQAGVQVGTFTNYLKTFDDRLVVTSDYLSNPGNASVTSLDKALVNNRLTLKPAEMIFIKKPVVLKDTAGKDILAF
jgi:endonuclease YncB( thermonuclease family)